MKVRYVVDGLGLVANTALGVCRGVRAELRGAVRDKIAGRVARLDLVSREEYEELRLMVEKLRAEQEKASS